MSIPAKNVRSVFIVTKNESPTLQYWIRGIKCAVGKGNYRYINGTLEGCNLKRGDVIVFVRVVPIRWIIRLHRLHRMGLAVKLFMDDGIYLNSGRGELPVGYAMRLRLEWFKQRYICNRWIDEIVVSTDMIRDSVSEKYGGKIAVRKAPLIPQKERYECKKEIRIVYYGTSSHVSEFKWLELLIERLEEAQSDIMIEIVASERWRRRLRKYSNVVLIYPMRWSEFKRYSSARGADIMLCPLMNSNFNSCRSQTKFFDAARLGAVGLYSNRAPYKGFVRDGVDGLLLEDAHDKWIACINGLVENHERCKELATSCRSRATLIVSN